MNHPVTFPGPALPEIVQLGMYVVDPLGTLSRWSRRFGSTFCAKFPGVGSLVFTSEPAHIREIFIAPPSVLEAGPQNAGLQPVVGSHSLFVLDGDEHARHRRLITPVLQGSRARDIGRLAELHTADAVAQWPIGQPFELAPHLGQLVLRIILHALCSNDDLMAPFAQLIAAYSSALVPMLAFWKIDPVRYFPRLRNTKSTLDQAVYSAIKRRSEGEPGSDGLGLLLSARDPQGRGLDDTELRDELLSLVLGGHETTAGALAWVIELLVDHPAVMARAAEDSELLDCVIKESLRLHPVLALVARRARVPFMLDRHPIEPGTWLAPSIYLTHRRADLYPEPERFRPERFLGQQPDHFHYLPFGGGARRCVGMNVALIQMKAILSTILKRVRLHSLRKHPAEPMRRNITIVPAGEIPIVCTLR